MKGLLNEVKMTKKELKAMQNEPGCRIENSFKKYTDKKHNKHKMIVRRMNAILEQVKGPNVADVGCGTGLAAYILSGREDIKKVYGIDIHEKAIEEAKENNIGNNKAHFYVGYAEELPFENEYFDTVIFAEALEHVADPVSVFKEFNRILKSKGKVIITTPHIGKISKKHIRSMDERFVKKLLENNGFTIKKLDIIKNWYPGKTKIFAVGVK